VDVFLLFFSASAILADCIVTMLLTRGISRERRKAFSALDPGGGKKCQTHENENLSLEEALSERFYRKKNVLGFLDSPPRAQVQITRAQEMRH